MAASSSSSPDDGIVRTDAEEFFAAVDVFHASLGSRNRVGDNAARPARMTAARSRRDARGTTSSSGKPGTVLCWTKLPNPFESRRARAGASDFLNAHKNSAAASRDATPRAERSGQGSVVVQIADVPRQAETITLPRVSPRSSAASGDVGLARAAANIRREASAQRDFAKQAAHQKWKADARKQLVMQRDQAIECFYEGQWGLCEEVRRPIGPSGMAALPYRVTWEPISQSHSSIPSRLDGDRPRSGA